MTYKVISLFLCLTLTHFTVLAEDKPHWSYSGDSGPDYWGELNAACKTCGEGKNQSPINLTNAISAKMDPLRFDYGTFATEIINNGHAIQANYAPGSHLYLGKHKYQLKQFHFHAPSENQIEGKPFPLEAHLVHAADDGKLAVVAIMFEVDGDNPAIARLWETMPKREGEQYKLRAGITAMALLPEDKAYFRFNGSLTTPPCTEGVSWFLMKQPVTISKHQVETFTGVMGHPNNRPPQPLNARVILEQM